MATKPSGRFKTLTRVMFIIGAVCLVLGLLLAHVGPVLVFAGLAALISGGIISAAAGR